MFPQFYYENFMPEIYHHVICFWGNIFHSLSGYIINGNFIPEKKPEVKKEKPVQNTDAKKESEKIKKQFHQLEHNIAELSKKKIALEADLGTPEIYSDKSKFLQTETSYKKDCTELELLNKDYEIIFEKMMENEN